MKSSMSIDHGQLNRKSRLVAIVGKLLLTTSTWQFGTTCKAGKQVTWLWQRILVHFDCSTDGDFIILTITKVSILLCYWNSQGCPLTILNLTDCTVLYPKMWSPFPPTPWLLMELSTGKQSRQCTLLWDRSSISMLFEKHLNTSCNLTNGTQTVWKTNPGEGHVTITSTWGLFMHCHCRLFTKVYMYCNQLWMLTVNS